MRRFDQTWLRTSVAGCLRSHAKSSRTYNGLDTPWNRKLMDECSALHLPTGSVLIFTRDLGMHSGGWWKNPDYERCYHLSLSFRDPITGESAPKDVAVTDTWLDAFYGDDRRYIWAEPPYSGEGKRADVWHYRVFCDPSWEPIIPRGEVYSKDFTERGWLSFSELQTAHARALGQLEALAGEQ